MCRVRLPNGIERHHFILSLTPIRERSGSRILVFKTGRKAQWISPSRGQCIAGLAFDSIVALPELSAVCIFGTVISDADAARIFAQMQAPWSLKICYHGDIICGRWRVLVPALTVLRAEMTKILNDGAGTNTAQRALRELHCGSQRCNCVTDWTLLVECSGEVGVLDVSLSKLGDACACDTLLSIQHLHDISLRRYVSIGSRSFDTVARLPELTNMKLRDTAGKEALSVSPMQPIPSRT